MRFRLYPALIAAFVVSASLPLHAGDATADWRRIEALDTGPGGQPKSPEEARAIVISHIDQQEKELRAFVAEHPGDAHAFEARLRLARLLSMKGSIHDSDKLRAEAMALLDQLDKSTLAPAQRVEVEFSKITTLMRNLREPTQPQREELLSAARRFQADHPADRRVAALLAETATLFDAQPTIKTELLIDAQRLVKDDDELKARIGDDLKRLDFLWKVLPLNIKSVDGKTIDVGDYHGKVVIVVFFAAWSPPSLAVVESLREQTAKLPADKVQVIGVSLDEKRERLVDAIRQYRLPWPVGFDGKGWGGPMVRSLGINAVPTVWVLDPKGRLRILNAKEDAAASAQQVLANPEGL